MSNLLSPLHIKKLDHEIDEIRNRALQSIFTKYQLRLLDEDDIESLVQLFGKLLDWFNYDVRHSDGKVFQLLSYICNTKNFHKIIAQLNPEKVLEDLLSIEKKTDTALLKNISEIKDKVLEAKRKNCGSVVTSLIIQRDDWKNSIPTEKHDETEVRRETKIMEAAKNYYLPWQPLSPSDSKILMSLFDGLRRLDETTSILESGQFLKDVIVEDFPIEILLQRPLILRTLFELLKINNEKLLLHAIQLLSTISDRLLYRINALKEPCMRVSPNFIKTLVADDESSNINHQLSVQAYCVGALESILKINPKHSDISNKIATITSRIVDILSMVDGFESCRSFLESCLGNTHDFPEIGKLIILNNYISNDKTMRSNFTRNTLLKSLGNPALLLFYNNFHFQIVKTLMNSRDQENIEAVSDFKEAVDVCSSMDAAIKLAKSTYVSKDGYLTLFENSLLSLEFHQNTETIRNFFKLFVNGCESKLVVNILLKLISHSYLPVRKIVLEEFYGHILKHPVDNEPAFSCFFHDELWKELLLFGGNHNDSEIQQLSRSILTVLMKSIMNLNEIVDTRHKCCVEANLALLTPYADAQTLLGRCVSRLMEPGDFQERLLPFELLLIGNLQLLFHKEITINEEAFARLCWLLAKDDPFEKKLPKVKDIKGLHLSSVCASVKQVSKVSRAFSSASALNNCLEALRNSNLGIDRKGAALNELAIILQDVSLHDQFLKSGGLPFIINILDSSLVEEEESLPSFVIPVIAVLNRVATEQASVRAHLGEQSQVICNIFRSLLLFTADEVFRENAVQLLFLLLYKDFILEVESYNKEFSLSALLAEKINVPILVRTHDTHSRYEIMSNRVKLLGNENLRSLIRIYWAAHWMGDTSALILLTTEDLEKDIFGAGLPEDMKVAPADLKSLQSLAFRTNIINALQSILDAQSHLSVIQNIHRITSYLIWMESYKKLEPANSSLNLKLANDCLDIENIPWEVSFARYLTMTPSCPDDEGLLIEIISFLKLLVRLTDDAAQLPWLSKLLTDSKGSFMELVRGITNTGYGIQGRNLRYGIIELCQEVITRTAPHTEPSCWVGYLRLIMAYLDANLADHLDKLLGLLVDITGAWSWNYNDDLELYEGLVTRVAEVIIWFKGLNDTDGSFMGCNMINNAMIVLGNLMSDASSYIKGWEQIWRTALTRAAGVTSLQDANYTWLLSMINHRDPMTRAAALALLSGFFTSASSFNLLFESLNFEMSKIWLLGLNISLNSDECSLVREKAALLLERLTALGSRADCSDFLEYIKNEGIYIRVGQVILSLNPEELKTSYNEFPEHGTITFRLVALLCNWLFMVCKLKKEVVTEHIVEVGLFQSLLTKYYDIVCNNSIYNEEWHEMNLAITRFVRVCVQASLKARQVICSNPYHVKSFCILLETNPIDSNNMQNLSMECEEVLCLISTILETDEGIDALRNALQGHLKHCLQNVLNSLHSATLRPFALSLVNNLAVSQLSSYFIEEIAQNCFGNLLCDALLHLDLKLTHKPLGNLFLVYPLSQSLALQNGFPERVLFRLKQIISNLSKFQLDEMRKPSRKKQIESLLDDIESFYQLVNNFCFNNSSCKASLAKFGLSDVCYKLWCWYGVRPDLLQTALKLLCTFTYQSEPASQSLALTAPLPGAGNNTLIHAIAHLAIVEMDLLSKVRDNTNLNVTLQLLSNSCEAVECRVVLARGSILTPSAKLLPSSNQKKIFSDDVLKVWLNFLNVFTAFPEGQYSVSRDPSTLELIFFTANGLNKDLQMTALNILVHLSMNPQNRCHLLNTPAPLLNILLSSFRSEDEERTRLAAAIVWSLAANSQKSKAILRSAGCDNAIVEASKMCLNSDCLQVLQNTLIVLNKK